jgi:8-oxo-dGTP pyrophosphatase MutT (NUDIX family)
MEKGVAAIIENYNGKFLLHLRNSKAKTMKNQYCLIGGSAKDSESATDALKREVQEETNLNILKLKFFKEFRFNKKNISIYSGKVDTRKNKLIKREGRDMLFLSLENIEKLLNSLDYTNKYLDALKEYLKL